MECWSKSYFKRTSKCDVVTNNMATAFNGWILEERCKSIIIVLEEIRTMVMNRMNVKRTWAETWRSNISLRALQKFERNIENSTQCRLVWNEDGGRLITWDYVNVNIGTTPISKLASTTVASTSKKLGMSNERVVTVPVSVPTKIGAHTSQFQHSWKGPGLS
ncbi:hypothetical protein V6N13_024717 [Hibiscus sabdariffa]|uniref:Uncharacterized protein n=1 Tax=Hibiscus sabdariffa TaxID=183260 RepID=A0ABR2QGK7_9ROSI